MITSKCGIEIMLYKKLTITFISILLQIVRLYYQFVAHCGSSCFDVNFVPNQYPFNLLCFTSAQLCHKSSVSIFYGILSQV
jgi:hypothetical protein